mmetsp:Transcript_31353/g.76443  ORF Transcript_31353/g.76443 Transcript_31353/m.76443 type:complete len:84 (+) Transcript_31353:547-798(+)
MGPPGDVMGPPKYLAARDPPGVPRCLEGGEEPRAITLTCPLAGVEGPTRLASCSSPLRIMGGREPIIEEKASAGDGSSSSTRK